MSLEDLAVELKIPLASLESVESGDITTLPSEIYYSLFARSYAEALGIDYPRTIEAIKEARKNVLVQLNDIDSNKRAINTYIHTQY